MEGAIDPKTARWLSPDPISHEGGPNLYAYVLNSPLTHFDLYGLFVIPGEKTPSRLPRSDGNRQHQPSPFEVIRRVVSHTQDFFSSRFSHADSDYSHIDELHKPELYSNVRLIYNCGMMTSKQKQIQQAEKVSEFFNTNVHIMHNPCNGFPKAIGKSIGLGLGFETKSVKETVKLVRQKIEELGGVNGGGLVVLLGYSQAGMVNYRSMQQLTPEERKMIKVITLGSQKIIPREGLADAINYANSLDLIPLIGNFSDYCKGRISNNSNLVIIKNKSSPLWQHDFFDPGYQKSIKVKECNY